MDILGTTGDHPRSRRDVKPPVNRPDVVRYVIPGDNLKTYLNVLPSKDDTNFECMLRDARIVPHVYMMIPYMKKTSAVRTMRPSMPR